MVSGRCGQALGQTKGDDMVSIRGLTDHAQQKGQT
jgi:hypothetical protein